MGFIALVLGKQGRSPGAPWQATLAHYGSSRAVREFRERCVCVGGDVQRARICASRTDTLILVPGILVVGQRTDFHTLHRWALTSAHTHSYSSQMQEYLLQVDSTWEVTP